MSSKTAVELDKNMTIKSIGDTPYNWFCPIETSQMRISGFSWLEKEKKYRRLPTVEEGAIPPAVDSLANCCSGGQISFMTNSECLAVSATFETAPNMYHMPATGQQGVDLYIGECGKMKYAATPRFEHSQKAYTIPAFEEAPNEMRKITINMPLYNSPLLDFKIGLAPNSQLLPPTPYSTNKKIVVYGTSITQGGCASRPGMSYTNILSRKIDAEFINLGFSGNGRGEPEVVKLFASIDNVGLFVIDYEANSNAQIYDTLEPMLDIIRKKNTETPLAVISRIGYGKDSLYPEAVKDAKKRKEYQKEVVEKRTSSGDKNIHFIDGSILLGEEYDECAVDGCHPTDLGFWRMAEGLQKSIKRLLL